MSYNSLHPLSTSGIASFLGISTRSVRRLVERGQLRPTRVGPHAVYLWEDVLACAGRSSTPGEDPPRLLDRLEVADLLGCAPLRVRELTATGVLKAARIGAVQRWWKDEVEALIGQEVVHVAAAG